MEEVFNNQRKTRHNNETKDNVANARFLKSYFERIGYVGNYFPDLVTLNKIAFLHPQAIPFENLDPLLRKPVSLDIQSLQKKLINDRRGGYCFEQNLLLLEVLKTIGFKVIGLSARLLYNRPDDIISPRGHMLLHVKVENEEYIVDSGFGLLTLTAPLKLVPEVEQDTPHEIYSFLKKDSDFVLQAKINDDWRPVYQFNLQESLLPDYEVASWYICNHPESHFIHDLILTRPDSPGKRYTLKNLELSTYQDGVKIKINPITSEEKLAEVLKNYFGLNLMDIDFKELFENLLTAESTK